MMSFIDKDAVRFGRTVATLAQIDNRVTLTFTDGQVASHAAAIGCGGTKGLTRRAVLADRYLNSVEPQYTHKYVYRTIVSIDEAKQILGDLATDAKMYMSKDSNLSTYPISGGEQVNVVAFKRDPKPWGHDGNTYDMDRKTMLEDFSDINVDDRLLRLLELLNPTRWAIFDHPNTPIYYNSLICLLGDVAHASGPHQGAGAGQGLEDALILTHALGKLHRIISTNTLNEPSPKRTRAVEAAFQAHDEIRRPRAQKQVRTAQECGEVYNLRDPKTGRDLSIGEALEDLNSRFEWLSKHDLEGDMRRVEERTAELLGNLKE